MAKPIDNLVQRLFALVEPTRGGTATDGQLLTRWAQERDNRAFAALVGRHGALVWRAGRSVLAQPEDAEDVFQATFLVLARKAAGLRGHPSIAGWLHQTAHHLAYKARTQAARRKRREETTLPKPAADPMEEISVREARAVLAEELERLPRAYREPLLLCLYEGATQDEAAQRLGCSLNTVKRRLERGRALLGQRLSKRGLAPASALAVTLYSKTHVSAQLVHITIAAATQFAGAVPDKALSATAVALANSVMRTLLAKKVLFYASLAVALSSLTLVGMATNLLPSPLYSGETGEGLEQAAAQPPRPNPSPPSTGERGLIAQADENAARLNLHSEPLPAGAVGRIGSSRLRPGGHITRMRFTPDGKSVAAISVTEEGAPGHVTLMDAETGKQRWRLEMGSSKYAFSAELAMSGDGKSLAVLDATDYKVIELETGKTLSHIREKDKKDDKLCALAIAPDLGMFARGYEDGTVSVYAALGASPIEKVRLVVGDQSQRQMPSNMSFSSDGKMLLVGATFKPDVAAYDTKTGKVVRLVSIAPDPAGSSHRFASPSFRFLVSIDRQQMVLRDVTNAQAHVLLIEKANGPFLARFQSSAFSPDESIFAAGASMYGDETGIVLFDTASGKERARLPGRAITLAFGPDGKTLASADWYDGFITIWDVATGKPRAASSEPRGIGPARFTADAKQVVTTGDGISWWDVQSGKLVKQVSQDPTWHGGHVPAVSPDGKHVAVLLNDGSTVLRNTATGKSRILAKRISLTMSSIRLRTVDTLFSPDSAKLIFVSIPKGPKNMWGIVMADVANGETLLEMFPGTQSIDTIAVSPDGRWLACAGREENLGGFGGQNFGAFGGKGQGNAPAQGFGKGKKGSAGLGTGQYTIQLWDLLSGTLAQRLRPRANAVTSLSFSADSSLLASALDSASWESIEDKRRRDEDFVNVQLWNVATGKQARALTFQDAGVLGAALSPDGRMVATGAKGKALQLWETATGKERARIAGHQTAVFSVDFAPDGRTLASASTEAVYLWDAYAALKPKLPTGKLSKEDKDKLWQSLADDDAAPAFQAMCEIMARPGEAAALLRDCWKQMPRAKADQMKTWLDDMYRDQPAVRKAAVAELERFAPGHEDLLRATLKQTGALEIRQQLEKILGQFATQGLRRGRMLEVLEHLGTPEARQFLEELAGQREDALLAREAAAGLKRLVKQK